MERYKILEQTEIRGVIVVLLEFNVKAGNRYRATYTTDLERLSKQFGSIQPDKPDIWSYKHGRMLHPGCGGAVILFSLFSETKRYKAICEVISEGKTEIITVKNSE